MCSIARLPDALCLERGGTKCVMLHLIVLISSIAYMMATTDVPYAIPELKMNFN
jgi:hypothetical protein